VVWAQTASTCAFTGTTVYATGAQSATPYLAQLSQVFASQTPPVNLVYFQTQSCAAVTALTSSPPAAQSGSAFYWTTTVDGGAPVESTCTPATPVYPDAAVSDVYATTCEGATVPANEKEFSGPVQAMAFAVNSSSTATVISEEAAHVVFKDIGLTNPSYLVAPWTNPAQLYIRAGGATGAGSRFMIGSAIGLADTDWSSAITNVETSASALLGAISGAGATANADETLGILATPNTDPNRPNSASKTPVKELAFQANGQECGYLPDSSNASFDKLNVRQGRYVIWGPIHFITAVSGGKPVNSSSTPGDSATDAAVQELIDLLTLNTTLTDGQAEASIQAAAQAGVVADCAMQVQRTGEATPKPVEYSYSPPEGSCGCYWESQTIAGATPTGCHTCTASTACKTNYPATPVCRYGFCEAN
jgi:hypothetical protein